MRIALILGVRALFGATVALLVFLALGSPPVMLAVSMPGYGLPACVTEDSTPVGGCVWRGNGGVWINYPDGS